MNIAVLPGDGIGPEIVAEAVKVLNALQLPISMETAPVGGAAYDLAGHPLPPATLDLAKSADFQPCKTIDLWERMAEQSGEKTFMNLFSSHPYSGDRAKCAKNHLEKNYSLKCNR